MPTIKGLKNLHTMAMSNGFTDIADVFTSKALEDWPEDLSAFLPRELIPVYKCLVWADRLQRLEIFLENPHHAQEAKIGHALQEIQEVRQSILDSKTEHAEALLNSFRHQEPGETE